MRTIKLAGAALALAIGTGSAAHAAGELYFYNWSNYFPPELIAKRSRSRSKSTPTIPPGPTTTFLSRIA